MNYSDISLKELFDLDEGELSQDDLAKVDSDEAFASLREQILEEIKGVKWAGATQNEILKGVGDEVLKKVAELLDIGIVDIMLKVWDEAGILNKYLDKEKYDPEETVLVPLAEHTIGSTHQPFIEILVNDKRVGKVEFVISIKLTVDGMTLKVQDGKIKELLTGKCEGSGSIKFAGVAIAEAETREIQLPGKIDFGNGIAIAP